MKRWTTAQPPNHFLVIEANPELRRILVAEIEETTGAKVSGSALEDLSNDKLLLGAVPVALHTAAESVQILLPHGTDLLAIQSRSVPDSMKGQTLPPVEALIAVVSRWEGFLKRARAVLIAAGISPEALSIRDAREDGWSKGLRSSSFVITDSLMARELPKGCEVRVFRIISDSSLARLRGYADSVFESR